MLKDYIQIQEIRPKLVALLWRAFQIWFYWLTFLVSLVVNNVVCRYKIIGHSPPASGPVLITMNHMSMWDLAVMFTPTHRPFHFVTKRELFDVKFVGGLLWILGCFPIKQGQADRQALQTARSFLKKGHMVGICPEGHRSRDYQLHKASNGVALLAVNAPADTWIVPIAVWGTEYIWQKRRGRFLSHRPPVTVHIGQPYHLSQLPASNATKGKHGNLEEITEQIMLKIAELMPEQYQGAYKLSEIAHRHHEQVVNQ
jgi:1-acyl-sn-glycerol-3-phosphate acyltransferase